MMSPWIFEDIYFDGDHFFEALLRDIAQARFSITIEIYIFNDDRIGQAIARALIEAHRRGVRVETIVDGVGSYDFFARLHGEFEAAGLEVKMFHPLPFYHPTYHDLSFRQKIGVTLTRLLRMNQRNHRKIITIDETITFVSSFNFTDEHTSFYAGKKWKDMGVRVVGQHAQIATLNFKKNWNLKEYLRYRRTHKTLLRETKTSALRMSHNLILRRYFYRDLYKRIKTAKHRIWLVTPYFIPKRQLIRAIGQAAKRGVDVRVLISSKSDVKLFQTLQFFYYPYLLMKGARIYQYVDTVLHAKNFIVDDWMTIGSSNLNHRSILHDLEVDLSIQNQINKELILQDFLDSTPAEREITNGHLKQRSLFDKFLSRLFFVFKYWF